MTVLHEPFTDIAQRGQQAATEALRLWTAGARALGDVTGSQAKSLRLLVDDFVGLTGEAFTLERRLATRLLTVARPDAAAGARPAAASESVTQHLLTAAGDASTSVVAAIEAATSAAVEAAEAATARARDAAGNLATQTVQAGRETSDLTTATIKDATDKAVAAIEAATRQAV
jgi:hypothetical protein